MLQQPIPNARKTKGRNNDGSCYTTGKITVEDDKNHTFPPGRPPFAFMRTGGQFVGEQETSAPSC
jgi:hypothetical protein